VFRAQLLPSAWWATIGEVAAMVVVVLLFALSREGAWHEKWLQSRHLAEQLRVAFFTRLAGVDRPESHVRPVTALPFYRGPDTWVFTVVDRVLAACPPSAPERDDWEPVRTFLATKWIEDQRRYHDLNAARRHQAAHRAHALGLWFFGGTLVAATLHLLHVGIHLPTWLGPTIDAVIVACAIALPAWGAALHASNALLERDRIAARSRQMARFLGEIATSMRGARRRQEFTAAVERARDVMLTETHEWLVSLSFRGPVLPA
jgi:hypothetical protein